MDFLVIDDDKTFRDATCLLIDGEGHYAEGACSGTSGLTELKDGKFDSVLLDLNLGAENGLDILEQILKRQPHLPVIIFTAQGSVKNAVEAMRRGAVDFLEKPFTREQFHLVLARVQRFHRLNQNISRLEREVKDSNAQSPEILLESSTPRMQEVMDTLMRAAKTPASILILGESGTGKSELALELITRGHRLVADDAPEFTLIAPDVIDGTCPDMLRDLLEVRGLGVLNVRDMFGQTAVKPSKYLRLIVHLKPQKLDAPTDPMTRLTGDVGYREVLGVQVPQIIIPVAPGRNIAVLAEAAVRSHMLKSKGFDPAQTFIDRQAHQMRRLPPW